MHNSDNISGEQIDLSGGHPLVNSLQPTLYVILVLGVVFFLYQLIGSVLTLIAVGTDFEKNIGIIRIITSFAQFFLILAPTLLFTRLLTSDLKGFLNIRLPHPLILFLSVLGITFINPVLQGYLALQKFILEKLPFYDSVIKPIEKIFDTINETTIKLVTSYSVLEFIIVVFVIAVTPAICEEFLFRGFVLKNFLRTSKASFAIFITGLLFGIYHLQPLNLVPLIALGIYISFIVYFSRSIITGIIAHFLNNFYAAYVVYIYGREVDLPDTGGDIFMQLVFTISSLVIFLLICFLIFKFSKKFTVE